MAVPVGRSPRRSTEAGRLERLGVHRQQDAALAQLSGADDLAPLPDRLTPHGLRHTCTSILIALGEDPGFVMDQIGHADPTFALRVYRHSMRRDGDDLAGLLGYAPGRIRTCDLALRRRALYPLSYGRSGDREVSRRAH
jgi:integrase